MQSFKRVTEASYLTAGNVWSYRAILRYFYIQHERMREFVLPEEIYAYLIELQEFKNYTEDELHQDLDQLMKWNNLVARQKKGRSRTIEEFKKKRFRYQCTPYTVEFKRMLLAIVRKQKNVCRRKLFLFLKLNLQPIYGILLSGYNRQLQNTRINSIDRYSDATSDYSSAKYTTI